MTASMQKLSARQYGEDILGPSHCGPAELTPPRISEAAWDISEAIIRERNQNSQLRKALNDLLPREEEKERRS